MARKPHLKPILAKTGAVLLALAVWQAASVLLGQKLLLVGPLEVAARLLTVWREPGFFVAVWRTFSRIVLGFAAGFAGGVALGLLAGHFRAAETLLWPFMVTVRSVPVASFVILALIWLTSSRLPVFISFLIVLPLVYGNVLTGVRAADAETAEMARVFRMPPWRRVLYLRLPALKPYLLSSCSVGAGLAFKSGVAAEIIGIPAGSVGEALYNAKVYLNTVDLFAWTVVIVLLSVVFEKILTAAVRGAFAGWERL